MTLKTDKVLKYLALKSLIPSSARVNKLSSQGLSSEVYSVDSEKGHFILKFYKARSEKTVAKELRIYRYLSTTGVPVPKTYFADVKGKIMNRPFILMQKMEGEAFNSLLKKGGGKDFVEALALSLHQLHSTNIKSLDLDIPRNQLKDEVSGLRTTAAILLALSWAPVIFHKVYKTLSIIQNLPVKGNPAGLLHGDCGPDNVIYSNGIVYLIDLESAYIGDPAFDLGYAYHCIRLAAPSKPELAENFIEAYDKVHGKVADLETSKRLAALKLAILLRFLVSINLLSLIKWGIKRVAGLLAVRKDFSNFVDYCLLYAEKGTAELRSW